MNTGDLLQKAVHRQWKSLSLAIFCAVLATLSSVALLAVAGWFLTAAGMASAAGIAALAAFNPHSAALVIRTTVITRTIGHYVARYAGHKAALEALAALRSTVFKRIVALDPRTVRPLSAAEGAARLTGDIDALEEKIIRIPAGPAALAAALFAVIATLPLGLATSVGLAILFLLLPLLTRLLAKYFLDGPLAGAQLLLGRYKAETAAQATAANEISIHNRVERATGKLLATAARLDEARLKATAGEALVNGLFLLAAPLAALVVLGSASSKPALVALGTLAAISATEAIAAFSRGAIQGARIATGLGRLTELEQQEEKRTATPAALHVSVAGTLVKVGEAVAIVGPTGSGKTRILESLAGLRSDAPQTLLVGGVPVGAIAFPVLAALSALVPQDPALIDATVADNLRLAQPDASNEALWAALAIACLAKEVRAMPEGLGSPIGEGGKRLSGGQRKRLALARALLAHRPLLLLDEPTEGLDPATEAQLVANLQQHQQESGQTILFSTHRPAMLKMANRTLHMEALSQN